MGCLEGKKALVTGSGQGIGKAIAMELAKEGADVIISARSADRLAAVKAEIEALGRKCIAVAADISVPETSDRMLQAVNEFGGLDILVNNAGINSRETTLTTTVEQFARIMEVNLTAAFRVTQKLLPVMIAQKSGCIVNITSSSAKAPHPYANPAYGCSKAAMTILTKELAQEFAKDGIRVNAVQCGPVDTEMTYTWSEEYRKKVYAAVPLGRIGTPREIGRAVVYLAGPDAGFITGASLNLNGGKFME